MRTLLITVLLAGCGTAPVCLDLDLNCDGNVNATEAPPCLDCDVFCSAETVPGGSFGEWYCSRDGERIPVASHHGFRCSSSETIEDHNGLRIHCAGVGGPARCVRETGVALPTDLDIAQCIGVE